ncbi:formylmethanofuran dehydrogenase subunit C [Geoglobus acetivorans]|uniref:formylmethanofuran dehydrogenase n=1 Tax=Geoglobus acetivorans TaxID=565033 RepID=A0A0A7GBW1_GEOAI|nr:Formylmethanofuran dehydrogenase subunit C [Geoglobus acetivorans]
MLILKPKFEFDVSVEAELTPELAEKSLEEIKNFRVWYGKFEKTLGELFDVQKEGDGKKLLLDGDFSKVKWVGSGMDDGEIVIKGNIGANCGAYMKGGRITIEGNADDWLGAEMKGGEIIVNGNAKNLIGCAYYGNPSGMQGGKILIEGDAGNYIGEKMAGGTIEIKGNAGDFIGTEMKGGEIIIHGDCGYAGGDMKSGTIKIGGEFDLLPTFRKSEDGWTGDILVGGEGKILKI